MGQEITHCHFKKNDFKIYRNKMDAELQWVSNWFKQEAQNLTKNTLWQKSQQHLSIGFELETCFIDKNAQPACINDDFMQRLKNSPVFPHISKELAQFNIELNSSVFILSGKVLRDMEHELNSLWFECETIASEMGCSQIMVGSLPSLQEQHLKLASMSHMTRYKALNEQILRSRKGRAIELDIQGSETLKSIHQDVMLEAAATSFQLHLQMPFLQSVRYYNAAIILSAPVVALTANSPFLFAKDLWCETRIPIFEQSVSVAGVEGVMSDPVKRVSFGSGYVKESLLECFQENNEHYPVLLAERFNTEVEDLAHLSLHNGTIWRWNRPLISYSEDAEQNRDYHVRLEHRVMPAGPTIVDSIANTAFFLGAVTALANQYEAPELQLSFVQAKENFYRAAKHGFQEKIHWLSGKHLPMKTLLLEYLLPMAKDGLNQLGVDKQDITYYLGIIEQRIISGQNGARWQRHYVEKHGKDMQALTRAYLKMQQSGLAVHEWIL